jgi:hypothetical protein
MNRMTKLLLSTYAISGSVNQLAHPDRAWFLPEVLAAAIGLLSVVVVGCAVYELWQMRSTA